MKCFRLRACVMLSTVFVQSGTSLFLPAGNCCRHMLWGGPALTRSSSQHRGTHSDGGVITMGAAGKKKKKLEKEALKGESGLSKIANRETQREADVLAEGLLERCQSDKRDLRAISADITDLRLKTAALKPSQSIDLAKDWRMVFASDDEAICAVGTGLHKLPLTRMQEFFVTLSGGSTTVRPIRAIEVLRVLGPFPNIRNTLSGDTKSTGPTSMKIRYTSIIDGTGKQTGSSESGELDRVVDVGVAFVGQGALVLETTSKDSKVGYLVFAKEPDLATELATLRVDGDVKES